MATVTPHRAIRRRGMIYVLVLLTCMIVAVLSLGGAYVRRASADRLTLDRDAVTARHAARSVFELALANADDGSGGWAITNADEDLARHSHDGTTATAFVIDADTGARAATPELPGRAAVIGEAAIGDARARLACDLVRETADEAILALNPLHYWPLAEPANTLDAEDLAGSHNGGYMSSAISAQATGPDGRYAPAFTDDASHGLIIPSRAAMMTADGTISFWFRYEAGGQNRLLLSKTGDAMSSGDLIIALLDTTLTVVHFDQDGLGSPLQSPDPIPTAEWVHVAYTWGTKGQCLFVNGTERGQVANMNHGLDANSGDQLLIGGPGPFQPFNLRYAVGGSIARVAWFDRDLEPSEVLELAELSPAVAFDPATIRWLVD